MNGLRNLFSKFIGLGFILFLFISVLSGQSASINVEIKTQEDIEDFVSDYENYIDQIHNLTISGLDIYSLDGLDDLVTISGDLRIESNGALKSLNGLHNLKSIGGTFFLGLNSALTDLKGLERLDSIGDNLLIGINEKLISVEGISNLRYLKGDLGIVYNDSLISINGFNMLEYVTGDLFIAHNPELNSIAGFSSLSLIEGDLYVQYNYMLTEVHSFCGFYNVITYGELDGRYDVSNNSYNPSQQEILENCAPSVIEEEIPTLGQWSIMILSLTLTITGLLGFRSMSRSRIMES